MRVLFVLFSFGFCALQAQVVSEGVDPKIVQEGEKRGRPPKGWPRLEWPILKGVLFGMYAPTQIEKSLVSAAVPRESQVKPKEQRKVLVFYRCQYPHTSIATGTFAFQELGSHSGAYKAVISDDPGIFTKESLAGFDAVLLNNTTSWDKTLGKEGAEALLNYVKSGGGLVGIHAASDACGGYKEGAEMIGGVFRCHPWLPKGTWAFQLEGPEHVLNAAFEGKGFWHRDEVYLYREGTFTRDRSHVLLSLDMSHETNCSGKHLHQKQTELAVKDGDFPVAWLHELGKGRVFYSNFGHNAMTYWNPTILKHYLDGIQYACGDLEAEAVPGRKAGMATLARAPEKQ